MDHQFPVCLIHIIHYAPLELDHRDANGNITIAELIHLECRSRFRVYQPLKEHRSSCPWVLITCHGEHTHPIPLPTKTPPPIKETIFDILRSLSHNLPDLTPRRFLRHSATNAFLRSKFPDIPNPTIIDLHPSLGNRDHLRSFISAVQKEQFPMGTGWDGEFTRCYGPTLRRLM